MYNSFIMFIFSKVRKVKEKRSEQSTRHVRREREAGSVWGLEFGV